MKLHIFNPEHDLALAANLRQFTAPHAGRQLRSDLAFIPALWADEGDMVLVDDIDDARDKVRHLGGNLADKVEFITKVQLQHFLKTGFLDAVHPWGWDVALKGELERVGCPEIMLPTDDILNKVRAISSRQWAAEHLQEGVEYAQDAARVKELIMQWGKAVVKAPWSSSGRGVRYVSSDEFRQGVEYTSFERWVKNIIFHQGGVTVEPYYNKVKDFGMEFEMRDGKMHYCGLSLFDTVKNAYTGNLLATEEEKIEMMKPYVNEKALAVARDGLITTIEPVIRNIYSGPLGVDMMIASGDKGYQLVPCIELNLRRTMGHVALALNKYLLDTQQEPRASRPGLMRVEFDGNKYHLQLLPGKPSENAPVH